jgi:hypothetical protein
MPGLFAAKSRRGTHAEISIQSEATPTVDVGCAAPRSLSHRMSDKTFEYDAEDTFRFIFRPVTHYLQAIAYFFPASRHLVGEILRR